MNGSRPLPYIVAVVVMVLFAVVAILGITIIRPKEDNIVVITLILGFLAPTIMSLLAFMKGQETNVQTQETHKIVNSELEKRVVAEKAQSKLEGIDRGMALVSRVQGPIDTDPSKPQVPPAVGFKVTSIFMRQEP